MQTVDYVVLLTIAVLAGCAVGYLMRRKKRGCGGCGGCCTSCPAVCAKRKRDNAS